MESMRIKATGWRKPRPGEGACEAVADLFWGHKAFVLTANGKWYGDVDEGSEVCMTRIGPFDSKEDAKRACDALFAKEMKRFVRPFALSPVEEGFILVCGFAIGVFAMCALAIVCRFPR